MAATGKSAAAKKKAATAKKKPKDVKVKLGKDKGPKAAAKPLPKDWPVTSRPPSFQSTDSALRPGSLLQEVCNGQDIHLNKQAVQAPSLAKEKGRFLIILPGNICLKSLKNSSTNSSQDNESSGDNDILATQTSNDVEEEGDDGGAAKTSKAALPQLGKIQGLGTNNPKLVVSFSGKSEQKSLVFPGAKVNTLSKYMWLNCSAKKKGTVACKGIFTTAIVFGAPTWETNTRTDDNSDAGDHNMLIEEKDVPVVASNQGKNWTHYGGSERTVDGVFKGSKKKKEVAQSVGAVPVPVPILSKEPIFDERGLPMQAHRSIHLKKASPTKAPLPAVQDLSRDTSDEDDEEFKMRTADVPVVKKRAPPRRQASAKRTKYTMDLLDSDVTEDDDSSSSDEDDNKQADKAMKPKARAKTVTKKQPKDSTVSLLDSDSDDVEISQKPKKATSTKARGNSNLGSDSSEEDAFYISDDGNEVQVSVASSARRTSSRASRGSAKKTSYKEKDESEESDDDNNDLVVEKPAKKRRDNSQGRRKSDPIELDEDDSSGIPKSLAEASPSLSSKSSPFRSRRRKSPAVSASASKKNPSAKRSVFDLSADDEFKF